MLLVSLKMATSQLLAASIMSDAENAYMDTVGKTESPLLIYAVSTRMPLYLTESLLFD